VQTTIKDISLLVVDDEPDLRETIALALQMRGAQVATAENGRAAFDLLEKSPVSVVVSDIRMPGGDGVELLGRVREKNFEKPVLIYMTGFSDHGIDDLHDMGADFVFTKPFQLKSLVTAILRMLQPMDARWSELLPAENKLHSTSYSLARGGAFVPQEGASAFVGEKVQFKLGAGTPDSVLAEGVGTVRWVRASGGSAIPAGVGIEFEYLTPETRGSVIQKILSLQSKAFIPKV